MTDLRLRFVTYNIHKGFNFRNRNFVLEQIKTSVQEIGSDFVLLQEVQGDHKNERLRKLDWVSEAQFEYLADRMWDHYAYAKNAIYDEGHHGNAILSRYPIWRWHNINLSTISFCSRSVLHGEILLPDIEKKIHVMCVHLGLRASERRRSLAIIEDYLETHDLLKERLIVAGDFNDWRGDLSSRMAHRLGLHEATWRTHGVHLKTFPARFPLLPLDRVYLRNVGLERVELLRGFPWNRLSDHLPIMFEIKITDNL